MIHDVFSWQPVSRLVLPWPRREQPNEYQLRTSAIRTLFKLVHAHKCTQGKRARAHTHWPWPLVMITGNCDKKDCKKKPIRHQEKGFSSNSDNFKMWGGKLNKFKKQKAFLISGHRSHWGPASFFKLPKSSLSNLWSIPGVERWVRWPKACALDLRPTLVLSATQGWRCTSCWTPPRLFISLLVISTDMQSGGKRAVGRGWEEGVVIRRQLPSSLP